MTNTWSTAAVNVVKKYTCVGKLTQKAQKVRFSYFKVAGCTVTNTNVQTAPNVRLHKSWIVGREKHQAKTAS